MRLSQDKAFYLTIAELRIQAGEALSVLTFAGCEWKHFHSFPGAGNPAETQTLRLQQFSIDGRGHIHA
jgi:hypothetical protein